MNGITKSPSVTILVTVKNGEPTIKKCVESLLRVNYPNKKIYVTEAYSTDRTYEILKQFRNKIKLERVKGNAPTAFNHMIKNISTEFIAFTDADCTVDRNWLKNLMTAFKSANIIASGGFVKTPNNVNELQKMIGHELENRFRKIPKYVSRLPTMNLCVRTRIAKKVKMNELLNVTFETEWGIRLTKFGKMIYTPTAIVYHHHRTSWKSFFKQQMNYARFGVKTPSIYASSIKFGDHLSTPMMGSHLIVFNLMTLFLVMSLFFPSLLIIAGVLLVTLLFLFRLDISELTSFHNMAKYLILYFVRTLAWTIGILIGLAEVIRGK